MISEFRKYKTIWNYIQKNSDLSIVISHTTNHKDFNGMVDYDKNQIVLFIPKYAKTDEVYSFAAAVLMHEFGHYINAYFDRGLDRKTIETLAWETGIRIFTEKLGKKYFPNFFDEVRNWALRTYFYHEYDAPPVFNLD